MASHYEGVDPGDKLLQRELMVRECPKAAQAVSLVRGEGGDQRRLGGRSWGEPALGAGRPGRSLCLPGAGRLNEAERR
jgi:hypothetical protein